MVNSADGLLVSANGLIKVCGDLRQDLRAILAMRKELNVKTSSTPLLVPSGDGDQSKTSQALRKQTMLATMKVLQLKSENRGIFIGVDEMRKKVEEAKRKTEADQLNLQNLLYEKAFLLREIQRCRNFTTDETNKIELVPEEEFLSTAPEDLKNVSKAESDHKFHLNRLSHELSLRKELQAELERTKIQKKAVLANTAEKEKFLAGIPAKLKQVEEATLPLQKYLKKPLSRQIDLREECRKLPTSLYLVYCQLDAFGASFGNVNVQIADSIYDEQQSQDNGIQQGVDVTKKVSSDNNVPTKKRKTQDTLSSSPMPSPTGSPLDGDELSAEARMQQLQAQDPYRPHPLAVTARFRSTGNSGKKVDLILRFQYLPKLDIVTVEPNGMSGLLANLFPNDTGQMVPRATVIIDQNSKAGTVSRTSRLFPERFSGRPYKWAQWLAGRYHLSAVNLSDSQSVVPESVEPPTSDIVKRILQRVHAQEMLSEQLNALSQCPHPVPVHEAAVPLFPARATSQLVKWEEISFDIAEAAVAASQPPKSNMPVIHILPFSDKQATSSKDDDDSNGDQRSRLLDEIENELASDGQWKNFGCRCFRGILQVGSNKVEAIVHVYVDYPKRLPRFTLSKLTSSGTRCGTDNNLKSIQIELNAFASELSVGTPEYLLSHQLRRLQMCLDVMAGDNDATRMFGRPRRGRDRRLAFVYNSETKQFVHR